MSKETEGRIQLFYNSNRNLNIPMLYSYLKKAYSENPLETAILIFYIRDCVDGKGERLLGRKALGWLLLKDYKTFSKLFTIIPYYGRWDDLIYLWPGVLFSKKNSIKSIRNNFNIKVSEEDLQNIQNLQKEIVTYYGNRLVFDRELMLKGDTPSFAAKWAPTENCRLDRQRKVVNTFCEIMGWTKKEYRQNYLSPLRLQLGVVERYLCDKKLESLDFDLIPSKAFQKYKKILRYALPEKYYSRKIFVVDENEPYPHQIVRDIRKTGGFFPPIWNNIKKKYKITKDFVCVLDNSPSGNSWADNIERDFLPSDIIYSLALIFSENASRFFKNKLITFSTNPQLEKIPKETLENKYKFIKNLPWGFVLDIEKVYDILLKANRSSKKILIISDKKIDDAIVNIDCLEKMEKKFNDVKLEFPSIIFWNLNNTCKTYPYVNYKNKIEIITGFSEHVIKFLLEGKSFTPYSSVERVILNERYAKIGHLLT